MYIYIYMYVLDYYIWIDHWSIGLSCKHVCMNKTFCHLFLFAFIDESANFTCKFLKMWMFSRNLVFKFQSLTL